MCLRSGQPRLPEKYPHVKVRFPGQYRSGFAAGTSCARLKKRPKLAALWTTMNYWIERSNAELRETLKHVDILMINDSEDARAFQRAQFAARAPKHIFKMGPSTLVVK